MGEQSTIQQLRAGCRALQFGASDAQLRQLAGHLQLLRRWNRRMNLTARASLDEMATRHALDSLALLPFLRGRRMLDIGSGGGLPGLPLAIARPESRWVLLDSRARRVEFLRYAAGQLGLGNVEPVQARVENYQSAAKFDTLTARAFAPLAKTLALTRQLQTGGSRLLAMKGAYPADELADLPAGLTPAVQSLSVPQLDAARHVVVIDF